MNIIEQLIANTNAAYDQAHAPAAYEPIERVLSDLEHVRDTVGKPTALERYINAHEQATGETLELVCGEPLYSVPHDGPYFAQLLPRSCIPCNGASDEYTQFPIGYGNTMLSAIVNLMGKL